MNNVKGVGIDVVNITRIQALLERYPQRFYTRVFTAREYAYALDKSRGDKAMLAAMLASRWAAKEAAVKALGMGFGHGLYWRDVEVVSMPGAAPSIQLHTTNPALLNAQFLLSMSHDAPVATAIVMVIG